MPDNHLNSPVFSQENLVDGRYSIKDLVNLDKLRGIFEEFSRTTGFTTGFVSYPDQEVLIATGWRDACTKFHRVCPGSAKVCKESNFFLTNSLRNLRELTIKPCGNGLVDGATPVIVRGKHLASVSTGQVLLEPPDLRRFTKQARKFGYDENAYFDAIRQLPVVTEQQLKQVLGFLSGLAVLIAEEGLNVLRVSKSTVQLRGEINLRRKSEQELVKSEEKYRMLFEGSRDAILLVDSSGRILDCNNAAMRLFKTQSKKDLISRRPAELSPPIQGDGSESSVAGRKYQEEAQRAGWCFFEWVHRKLDGTDFPSEVLISSLNIGGTNIIQGVIRDISERKRAANTLVRTNRLLTAIDECNFAVLHAQNEVELFREICRIIVGTAGYRMAWVGLAQHDSRKSVHPVAQAGVSDEFLRQQDITWANTPRGRGITGTAIRTRKIVVSLDFQNRTMARSFVQAAGYGNVNAAIGIPVIIGNECIGALSIYSSDSDVFDVEGQLLLEGLVKNLTNGIVTMRARAEREQMQKELLLVGEQIQRRLGQELHDDLGQQLTGMSLIAGVIEKNLTRTGSPIADEVRGLLKMLTDATTSTRALAHGLFPLEMEPGGLMVALEKLAARTSMLPGVRCRLKARQFGRIDPAHAIQLYRIVQEAVNNAIKHGSADEILIRYSNTNGSRTIEVASNGNPFKKPRNQDEGIGLKLMRHRAELIGVRLNIGRGKNGGCRVVCTIPGHRGFSSA